MGLFLSTKRVVVLLLCYTRVLSTLNSYSLLGPSSPVMGQQVSSVSVLEFFRLELDLVYHSAATDWSGIFQVGTGEQIRLPGLHMGASTTLEVFAATDAGADIFQTGNLDLGRSYHVLVEFLEGGVFRAEMDGVQLFRREPRTLQFGGQMAVWFSPPYYDDPAADCTVSNLLYETWNITTTTKKPITTTTTTPTSTTVLPTTELPTTGLPTTEGPMISTEISIGNTTLLISETTTAMVTPSVGNDKGHGNGLELNLMLVVAAIVGGLLLALCIATAVFYVRTKMRKDEVVIVVKKQKNVCVDTGIDSIHMCTNTDIFLPTETQGATDKLAAAIELQTVYSQSIGELVDDGYSTLNAPIGEAPAKEITMYSDSAEDGSSEEMYDSVPVSEGFEETALGTDTLEALIAKKQLAASSGEDTAVARRLRMALTMAPAKMEDGYRALLQMGANHEEIILMLSNTAHNILSTVTLDSAVTTHTATSGAPPPRKKASAK